MDDYLRIAAIQGSQPRDFAAFRRYLSLQALSLLRQQTQIARLQQTLKLHVPEGSAGPSQRTILPELTPQTAENEASEASKQLALWNNLDAKLTIYSKSLLRFDALCRLSPVDHRHHQRLTGWLTDPAGGNNLFRGIDGDFWREEHLCDLAALGGSPPSSQDTLSNVIQYCVAEVYHRFGYRYRQQLRTVEPLTGREYDTAAYEYSDANIAAVVNAINAGVASLSISLSVLVLYFIPSMVARLGTIIAFNCAFSAVLVLMTGASRTECFVATAAYAAVLVVFVGGDAAMRGA